MTPTPDPVLRGLRLSDAFLLRQRSAERTRLGAPRAPEAAIAPCTWPEQKAPHIQHVLRRITDERDDLSLDFLTDLPVPEARQWLERIRGVGPKTSAAVLLFSRLRRPAFPMGSHHHVAQRLGLIPDGVPALPRARTLPDGLEPG